MASGAVVTGGVTVGVVTGGVVTLVAGEDGSSAGEGGGGVHTVAGGARPGDGGVPFTSVVGTLGVGGGDSSVEPPLPWAGRPGVVSGGSGVPGSPVGGFSVDSPGEGDVGGVLGSVGAGVEGDGVEGDGVEGEVSDGSTGRAGHGMSGRSGAGRNAGVEDGAAGTVVIAEPRAGSSDPRAPVDPTDDGLGVRVAVVAEVVELAPSAMGRSAGPFSADGTAVPAGDTDGSSLGARV